jgi:hypothetical protein
MNLLICTLLLFTLFQPDDRLERAREQYSIAHSISYQQTAYYPIPDVDIVDSAEMSVMIFNPGRSDYEFLVTRGEVDEVYQDGVFSEVRHSEKAYYRYENRENQKNYLSNSNLGKYGPVSLLKHQWDYLSDTLLEGQSHAHFMRVEKAWEYEGKQIVVEHHIFFSPSDLLIRFERRNHVDGILTQTVTYRYDDYRFDQDVLSPEASAPERYSLKYFERADKLRALEKGAQAPDFEAIDTRENTVSFGKAPRKQTLLLFGSITCGYSQLVIDHISQTGFRLKDEVDMLTFLGSDSQDHAVKYLDRFPLASSVIADRRDIETAYGIAGYPILYLVDQNGLVVESLAGSSGIIELIDELAVVK